LKIAQVIAVFPPFHGGMGYICFHNTRELARRGHEVTVFTLNMGQPRYESDPADFRIERLGAPLRYGDGGAVPQLASRLKPFDIIHLHYPFFGGAEYVYLASRLWGKKYFLTYHMDVYGNTFAKRILIGTYEPLLMKRIIQRASLVTGPGKEYLKSTKAAGMFDWDRVVEAGYGGVDVERYSPREKDPTLLRKYGLEGKVVALFVGNLQPFKGLHLLIDAVAGVDDPNLALLVVGGGYGEEGYRKQVRERGLEGRAVFAGPQSPDGALPAHFNLGDFLVLPSTHSESFGLVILEAMASGKPAIVSALPGPSQLVDEGRDGMIVRIGDVPDLTDKVRTLTRETQRRAGMGAMAREKVLRKYRWETIGENLERAFNDILNR
jgi:glycosyltransferase involved in cell wall biosynthesis